MTILNFVTQEELDNLNGDDPRIAFMELVNLAQRRLSEQTSKLDPDDRHDSAKRFDIEKKFMNVIVASGKQFEVEPFSSMEVPRHQNFSNSDYEQFQSDLDHYVTQLILGNSSKSKNTSVELPPHSKDKIRVYVHALKECVEKANMQPSMRKSLLAKLSEFEKELEKRRINFVSLSMIAIAIIGAPGGAWESFDITQRLITSITQVLAEAKQTEDQTRQIGSQTVPKALSPPRAQMDKFPSRQPSQGSDLDDEIPF